MLRSVRLTERRRRRLHHSYDQSDRAGGGRRCFSYLRHRHQQWGHHELHARLPNRRSSPPSGPIPPHSSATVRIRIRSRSSTSTAQTDTRIRYNGGEGEGTAHIDGPAIPALNATWRAIDGCGAPNVTTSGVVTTSIANCPNGRTVELITIDGAGHQWPGAPGKPLIQKLLGTDPPSTALNATSTIWQFFAQHHK